MASRSARAGAALLALAVVTPAALVRAEPVAARKPPVPAYKLFPYLDRYLKLPAAERTLFSPAYVLMRDHRPARDLRLTLVDGARREPLAVASDGRIERLPSLGQLATATVEIDAPAAARFSVGLQSVATLKPAAEMPAAELSRAVRQADAGSHKAAGMLAMMLPKLDRAVFFGVPSGQAVLSGGGSAPLPLIEGHPYADLPLLAKASAVRFERAPWVIEMDGAPKK